MSWLVQAAQSSTRLAVAPLEVVLVQAPRGAATGVLSSVRSIEWRRWPEVRLANEVAIGWPSRRMKGSPVSPIREAAEAVPALSQAR